MSDKKHIDRIFQERFKDFEAAPDSSVWNNIQASLNTDKKRRRVIPIWWKFAGVAAVLLLLFTIGNSIYNSDSENQKEILVDSENSTPKDLELDVNNSNNSLNKNNTITTSVDDLKPPDEIKNNSSNNSNDAINQKHKSIIKNYSQIITKSNLKKNNIASSNKETDNKSQVSKNNLNTISKPNKNTVAIVKNQQLESNSNSSNNIDEKANSDLIKNTISKTTDAVTQTENSKEENNINELKTLEEVEEETKKEEGTLSIEEELAETNNEKEEEIIEEEELKNRWNVMPNIAPVYFNTLGKGSSIDGQFANNDKSGTVNMSYGIAASYDITNRLTVRSGVNKVNIGYNTNDVLIYQGVEATSPGDRPIKSIDFNQGAQNTIIISADNFAFAQVPGVLTNAIDASLDQRLGFIEVPLELSYKVSDKKLGINVIGGVSALFLNENEVYSTLNGNSTLLGEANNINETSFSANFGLGLDYKLSDKFDINLEPLFKYQMNTFKNTSGDFKPFVIGIYTGFSFKF